MGISSGYPPDDPKHNDVVMGYPSADRYRPPQLPAWQGYTCASSPFQIPPHHNDYPNSTVQNLYPPPKPQSSEGFPIGRVMLIVMIVLIASMCMMSLAMWLLFGSHIPEFQVASLKVSNFSVTDTNLTATWTVDLCINNTNTELSVHFDDAVSSILYKDALLGTSPLNPFQAPPMKTSVLNYSVSALNDHEYQNGLLSDLSKNLISEGTVVFGLRMVTKANYTTPTTVYGSCGLKIWCDNMKITFSSSGEGNLAPGLRNACLISVQED